MMSNSVSERLQQNAQKIMQMWEVRARNEVSASMHQDSLVLQNSLPLYLNQLVDKLSTQIDRTPAQITTAQVESTPISKQHGHERAFPQHLIGVAIELLRSRNVGWSQVKTVEGLSQLLKP